MCVFCGQDKGIRGIREEEKEPGKVEGGRQGRARRQQSAQEEARDDATKEEELEICKTRQIWTTRSRKEKTGKAGRGRGENAKVEGRKITPHTQKRWKKRYKMRVAKWMFPRDRNANSLEPHSQEESPLPRGQARWFKVIASINHFEETTACKAKANRLQNVVTTYDQLFGSLYFNSSRIPGSLFTTESGKSMGIGVLGSSTLSAKRCPYQGPCIKCIITHTIFLLKLCS